MMDKASVMASCRQQTEGMQLACTLAPSCGGSCCRLRDAILPPPIIGLDVAFSYIKPQVGGSPNFESSCIPSHNGTAPIAISAAF